MAADTAATSATEASVESPTKSQIRRALNRATPDEELLSSQELPRTGKILVVDDNEMNRDMLSRRLARQGHRVDVAVNGQQALDMIRDEDFDLILLDIMMPEMNGYEVLERMKADETIPYIPVIMITAVDEIESLVRCVELGAEDYLPKPFNPVLLRARIGASLEKKQLRDRQEAYTHYLNLENQRKSEELEQARRIQRSMLPMQPPLMPHLDLAAHQETASEVGGDYYDFFVLPDGKLLLTVGDATGHGVGSGLMVAMTKASLRATEETDLVVLLKKINGILSNIDLGSHLNMALMLLEVSEMLADGVKVKVCGGGMPPMYILRAQGGIQEVLISGLPLGINLEANYAPLEFQLQSGDTLVIISDGLLEMFNSAHEILGFERLTTELAQIEHTALTANQVLRAVSAIGQRWANGHPLIDDITVVVMRVK